MAVNRKQAKNDGYGFLRLAFGYTLAFSAETAKLQLLTCCSCQFASHEPNGIEPYRGKGSPIQQLSVIEVEVANCRFLLSRLLSDLFQTLISSFEITPTFCLAQQLHSQLSSLQ